MKQALITALAAMAALSLYGQGTIDFKNDATSFVMWDADGSGPTAAVKAPAGGVNTVGFFWAANGTTDESQFQLLGSKAIAPSTGLFSGGTLTLPSGAGGDQIAFMVKAWTTASGGYAAALASGNTSWYIGKSQIYQNFTTGGGGTPPGPPLGIIGTFGGLTMNPVPEPSTIALGLLGLAGLFVLRRRS